MPKSRKRPKPAPQKTDPVFWMGSTQMLGQSGDFVLLADGNGKIWRVSIKDCYAYPVEWR